MFCIAVHIRTARPASSIRSFSASHLASGTWRLQKTDRDTQICMSSGYLTPGLTSMQWVLCPTISSASRTYWTLRKWMALFPPWYTVSICNIAHKPSLFSLAPSCKRKYVKSRELVCSCNACAEGARLYTFTQYLKLTVLESVSLPVLQTAWGRGEGNLCFQTWCWSGVCLMQRSSRWIFSTGMLYCLHNNQTVVWESKLRKLMCHLWALENAQRLVISHPQEGWGLLSFIHAFMHSHTQMHSSIYTHSFVYPNACVHAHI